VRLDGLPRSGHREPDDPGAAVYFSLHGKPRCLACDRWNTVAENLAAIAAHVSAIRAVDRYGVGTLDQAFAGYAQLPASTEEWWTILGVAPDASRTEIDEAFRALAKKVHPDAGGSNEAMARLNEARRAAHQYIGG
jgi:DnaJ-domain-containing protein 1